MPALAQARKWEVRPAVKWAAVRKVALSPVAKRLDMDSSRRAESKIQAVSSRLSHTLPKSEGIMKKEKAAPASGNSRPLRSARRRRRMLRLRQSRKRRREEHEKFYNMIRYGRRASRRNERLPRPLLLRMREYRRLQFGQLARQIQIMRQMKEKLRLEAAERLSQQRREAGTGRHEPKAALLQNEKNINNRSHFEAAIK